MSEERSYRFTYLFYSSLVCVCVCVCGLYIIEIVQKMHLLVS